MAYVEKNNTSGLQFSVTAFILFSVTLLCTANLFAQEKVATIKLDFANTDSSKICKVTVTSDNKPVTGTDIHLYVKRMYSLLPIGKAVTTDSSGKADFNFPMDLPGDKSGMLTVVARIEGDDNYGNVQTSSEIKWGAVSKNETFQWSDRSLSASREKAPMFLVVSSILIILIIWGTIVFLISQLFRIKNSNKILKKADSTRN